MMTDHHFNVIHLYIQDIKNAALIFNVFWLPSCTSCTIKFITQENLRDNYTSNLSYKFALFWGGGGVGSGHFLILLPIESKRRPTCLLFQAKPSILYFN